MRLFAATTRTIPAADAVGSALRWPDAVVLPDVDRPPPADERTGAGGPTDDAAEPEESEPGRPEQPEPAPAVPPARRRRFDPLTVCVVVATAVFALAGIGSPLLGLTVFADTGSLGSYSGYRDVLAGVTVHTQYQRDLVDDQLPNEILFGSALRSGQFAAWSPYVLGGGPLASTPNLAVASPLSAPFWLLPGWLAPAYVKLLELLCAIGGTFLFLRRLRLSRAAAVLGGLVFAGSAFMVVWSGWPQTRVAALIPAFFWGLECLVQRVRPREIGLVALPVTAMLLGGFPAVTGYALATGGVYFLARVLAEPGRELWHRSWARWRPVVARLAAATAAVVAGVGLAAWQLVPWIHYMGTVLLAGRAQDPEQVIPISSLLTTIAPYALGTVNPAHQPTWFGPLQLIDAESYLGAAALVLVVTSVALASRGRTMLPRGVWWTLVTVTAAWATVIYVGGPLLELLQRTSFLFSDNFVGRARSVLGFLLAVLAAVGFDIVVHRRRRAAVTAEDRAPGRWERLGWRVRTGYGLAVWAALGVAGLMVYRSGWASARLANSERTTPGPDALTWLNVRLGTGLAIMATAGACVAWLWWGARWRGGLGRRSRWLRLAAAGVLPLLVAGQSLAWVASYYPRTERDDFYPTTPTQSFLASHLGHGRYYGADGAIFGSVDVTAGLRSLHGHGLLDQRFADLVQTLPGEQFTVPPTAIISNPNGGLAARSPMLDQAAVNYYVAPPKVQPFGPVTSEPVDPAATTTLQTGVPVRLPLPVTGPVRGIGFTPAVTGDTPAGPAQVRLVLRTVAGAVVADNTRADPTVEQGRPWIVAVAAESVPARTGLVAEITLLSATPLIVQSHRGRPALSVVQPTTDGLRLVYAQESVIYQRLNALPRARWASVARVVTDPAARVALVASGQLPRDGVVLSAAGPAADGRPATVSWLEDGLNQLVLGVAAQGAGYLVVADAIQVGWKVTVDGAPAELVAADHAFAAVAVGPGQHTIRFFYSQPWDGPGVLITAATGVSLLLALGLYRWRRPPGAARRDRRGPEVSSPTG